MLLRPWGEVESGNVALAKNGAKAVGPNNSARNLIDGRIPTENWAETASARSPTEWTITLPQLYSLREIRLLLYSNDRRAGPWVYQIGVSADGQNFTMLVDRSQGQWPGGWYCHRFPAREVKAIRLHGSGVGNRGNAWFSAAELEAYCIPPHTRPRTAGVSRPEEE